uniref:Disintegrin and metalloproteinase domain-containing protein 17 n=2 Tax=Schistocephalus solidus TaxID=70667 RepID=A0A0X3PL73_SCHSO
MEIVLLVFVNILFNSFCIASAKKFNDILNHYEIINNPHLSENYSNLRFLSVQLKIFGRSLKIHLFLYLANFDKNALQIHLPDKDQFDTTKISLPDFFKGHVIGITPSSAYAHINSKREFSATLVLPDSVIIIEPLSVYQQDNSDKRLIVYRLNDIRNFNLYVLLYLPLLVYASSRAHDVFPAPPTTRRANYVVATWRRTHRSLPEQRKLCGLHFIADYSFFFNIGRQDHAKTVEILLKTFNRVNEIFLSTVFYDETERPVTGYGFYLKGITIESISSGANLDKLSPRKLLYTFSQRSLGDACLIHLFTYSPNLFGVLGMSWMASPALQHLGGICSPPSVADTEILASNTGFTSFSDSDGAQVLSSLAELVTAHELGHSLGAPHDPNTAECSPSAAEGGKFLMYTYAVPGYSPNNYLFSPCSRRAMSKVILAKAPLCFEEEVSIPMSQCGNSRVDSGEECDPGVRSVASDCCTTSCRLRAGAQCSPLNHNCCTKEIKRKSSTMCYTTTSNFDLEIS